MAIAPAFCRIYTPRREGECICVNRKLQEAAGAPTGAVAARLSQLGKR